MRAVVQRVKSARVEVEGETIGAVDHGLLVFLGVTHSDTEKDAKYLAERSPVCASLRTLRIK